MEVNINALMTIALGVFIALVARDILRYFTGRLFGFGNRKGGKEKSCQKEKSHEQTPSRGDEG
jgi:membrane protein DedA with SNARE-associated domain